MTNISIENEKLPIYEGDFNSLCDNLRRRVLRVLYLRDDLKVNIIQKYDMQSYITALIWDMYGAYIIFKEYRFLNCICELQGIKDNLEDDFVRKKILDLASFIKLITE